MGGFRRPLEEKPCYTPCIQFQGSNYFLRLRTGQYNQCLRHPNACAQLYSNPYAVARHCHAGTIYRHRHAAAATPSGLTATASGANSIELSWTPLAGASHFGVYRCLPSGSGLPAFYETVSENVPGATYTTQGGPASGPTITD